jgi:hypothetical protein
LRMMTSTMIFSPTQSSVAKAAIMWFCRDIFARA